MSKRPNDPGDPQCPKCIHPRHEGRCTGVVAGPPGAYYGSPDDQPSPCRCEGSPVPDTTRFVLHDQGMVEPDFDLGKMHPNEEPFWLVFSPYSSANASSDPFLLDRGGMYALIEQCQKALADYYVKFPLSQAEVDPDQMRPGRIKARPPVR